MTVVNYPCRSCGWPNHFTDGAPSFDKCNRCGKEVDNNDRTRAIVNAIRDSKK